MSSSSAHKVWDLSICHRVAQGRCQSGARAFAGLFLLLVGTFVQAQTPAPGSGTTVQGSLVQLVTTAPPGTFNQLEQLSAIANQASYNYLTANPNGSVYCNPAQTKPSATCNAQQFLVFDNVRELVQSANELLNNGQPTLYSLHTDDQGLGFALRWTAGENLAAPGSVATQFANGQLSSVAARIDALRLGASGFVLNGFNLQPDASPAVALNTSGALGGGASADSNDVGIASRWGGFFNGAYGWGFRQPSVLEDAFAFDSTDATLGVDYRFSRRLVLGASASYTHESVDFDSERSIAGGGFRSNGYGVLFYGLYEWEGPYVTASAGWQRSDLNETRLITYPSFNIAVPSTSATAQGSTHTNSLITSFSAGWVFTRGPAAVEPFVSVDYRHVDLSGFQETSVNNAGAAAAGQTSGFALDYAPQQFRIGDSALGLSLRYTFTPRFGVIVPYARAAYHHTFDANTYSVVGAFSPIAGSGAQFVLPTDPAAEHFYEFGGGFSVVLKRGFQGFVQFQMTSGMEYVTSRLISAGIRAEL